MQNPEVLNSNLNNQTTPAPEIKSDPSNNAKLTKILLIVIPVVAVIAAAIGAGAVYFLNKDDENGNSTQTTSTQSSTTSSSSVSSISSSKSSSTQSATTTSSSTGSSSIIDNLKTSLLENDSTLEIAVTSNSEFEWRTLNGILNLEGPGLHSPMMVESSELETESMQYFLSIGYTADTRNNYSNSLDNSTHKGVIKGTSVCLIRSIPPDQIQAGIFTVTCGDLTQSN